MRICNSFSLRLCCASGLLCLTLPWTHALAENAQSIATVQFEENDTITNPVDPQDPSKETDPAENGGAATSNKGPLSLDVAPVEFAFGTQKMYHAEHTYQAVSEGTTPYQYLQVTDNRDAGQNGWVVKVKQETYLRSADYELTGTTINIPKGTPRNNLNTPTTKTDDKLLTYAVAIDTSEQVIFESTARQAWGKGTSTSMWASDQVSLTIPAETARAGNYTNTIVWTLAATVDQ